MYFIDTGLDKGVNWYLEFKGRWWTRTDAYIPQVPPTARTVIRVPMARARTNLPVGFRKRFEEA